MSGPLRVMLTADPELPVPPRLYGGIERIVGLLADGLTARGHHVVLIAHRDSHTSAELVPYLRADSAPMSRLLHAFVVARAAVRHRPAIVHSFGRLSSLAGPLLTGTPTIMSYQRAVTAASIVWGRRLGRRSLTFAACSDRMLSGVRDLAPWRVIHNAVDPGHYQFAPVVSADAPLVFLGRVEPIKGPHVAIEIARRSGRRLIIAGNIPPEHCSFFDEAIRPYLDGDRVTYVGPVDDAAKSALLSSAAALLMPVLWEEPFGIVMAEALACGTPVIGLSRGAVPEVVEHGVTGFVGEDAAALIASVARISHLDRRACRVAADTRFSHTVLVDRYESLYRELVAAKAAPRLTAASSGPTPIAAREDR